MGPKSRTNRFYYSGDNSVDVYTTIGSRRGQYTDTANGCVATVACRVVEVATVLCRVMY